MPGGVNCNSATPMQRTLKWLESMHANHENKEKGLTRVSRDGEYPSACHEGECQQPEDERNLQLQVVGLEWGMRLEREAYPLVVN